MLIETTKGPIEESRLIKAVNTEEIPCGWSDCTRYSLDGEVVREDVNIRVKEGIISEAFAGQLGNVSVKAFIEDEYRQVLQSFVNTIGGRVQTRYPELVGMSLSFNLPGLQLNIKPGDDPKTEA